MPNGAFFLARLLFRHTTWHPAQHVHDIANPTEKSKYEVTLLLPTQEPVAGDIEGQASQDPLPAPSPLLPQLRTSFAQHTERLAQHPKPKQPRDAAQQAMLQHIRAILQVDRNAPLSVKQPSPA